MRQGPRQLLAWADADAAVGVLRRGTCRGENHQRAGGSDTTQCLVSHRSKLRAKLRGCMNPQNSMCVLAPNTVASLMFDCAFGRNTYWNSGWKFTPR